VAAHPYNHRFAATHLLSLPAHFRFNGIIFNMILDSYS